jgi:superoxide dismutase
MVCPVPADRTKYIDAFFANVDWDAVQGRLRKEIIEPAA